MTAVLTSIEEFKNIFSGYDNCVCAYFVGFNSLGIARDDEVCLYMFDRLRKNADKKHYVLFYGGDYLGVEKPTIANVVLSVSRLLRERGNTVTVVGAQTSKYANETSKHLSISDPNSVICDYLVPLVNETRNGKTVYAGYENGIPLGTTAFVQSLCHTALLCVCGGGEITAQEVHEWPGPVFMYNLGALRMLTDEETQQAIEFVKTRSPEAVDYAEPRFVCVYGHVYAILAHKVKPVYDGFTYYRD
jgi:hypothetical protein